MTANTNAGSTDSKSGVLLRLEGSNKHSMQLNRLKAATGRTCAYTYAYTQSTTHAHIICIYNLQHTQGAQGTHIIHSDVRTAGLLEDLDFGIQVLSRSDVILGAEAVLLLRQLVRA